MELDIHGVGNTTTGNRPFSIQQFANDTAGLLDALKIQKADVLGYSLGSFMAQQLAVTHPDKVNRLVLIAASCVRGTGLGIQLLQLLYLFTFVLINILQMDCKGYRSPRVYQSS